MIRYRYVNNLQPPAPFLNVTVGRAGERNDLVNHVALLDTAADRTVLPAPIVEALALVADGRASFQGFGGEIIELPLFLVEIRLHDFPPIEVRATIGKHEPFILLGRDLLNQYRIVLDGPQQFLEIEPP